MTVWPLNGRRRNVVRAARAAALVGAVCFCAVGVTSCHTEIDTERKITGGIGTLGQDMYGVLCDRLGGSTFTEDLTGASYHYICHYDSDGEYSNVVDTSVLPPVSGGAAAQARQLAIFRMERMARVRPDLIAAFDGAFPDIVVPDATVAGQPCGSDADCQKLGSQTCLAGQCAIRLHDALLKFSQEITQLYETNPFEPGGAPLNPQVTQAIGRLFSAFAASGPARMALESIAARRGYRPYQVQLGAVRALLGYDRMREFTVAQLGVLAPDGNASPELQQLLRVSKQELLTSAPMEQCVTGGVAVPIMTSQPCGGERQPLAPLTTVGDPAEAQPNRARMNIEVLQAILLDQHDAYAGYAPHDAVPPRYIAARDHRGFAIPFGNVPGQVGTVHPPFADMDGNGFADVNSAGQFLDDVGQVLWIDPPFRIPGVQPISPVDFFDRPDPPLYQYIDTRRTPTGGLAEDLAALLSSEKWAADDDPQPWMSENETVMYALAGLRVLNGRREPAQWDYVNDVAVPAGEPCPDCLQYRRFKAEESPLPDLFHALGQLLADPESDALLLALIDLFENHESVVARLMGEALRIKEFADEHDVLADQGQWAKAELAYEVPIWDEFAQVVSVMAEDQALMERVLLALTDERIVKPFNDHPAHTGPTAQHMGDCLATFMTMRDHYMYNRWQEGESYINGPTINITDGFPSMANPHNPVDRTQPLVGDNRSMFERSIQLVYDTVGVKACNKDGARVSTGWGAPLDYFPIPPMSPYAECELFTFENMGAFYLDSTLPLGHPKRAELVIKPGELTAIMNLLGIFVSEDEFLEDASGITNMTMHPTNEALNRLMFFGASSDAFGVMADYDTVQSDTNPAKFTSASIDAMGGPVCWIDSAPDTNDVSHCASVDDVLRMRGYGIIFGWERLGFVDYQVPVFQAFAETACNPSVTACDPDDYTGEGYFGDIISVLWRHWPDSDHGSYCNGTGGMPSNPAFCSSAGLNHYEPIIAHGMQGDLMFALHEFAKVARDQQITIARGPHKGEVITGPETIAKLARILFSQPYAGSVAMTDRFGNPGTTWVDGTLQPQVTVFSLFADALHNMDVRFEQACSCEGLVGDEWSQCEGQKDACLADTAARRSKWKRARSQLVDRFLAVEGEGGATRFVNRATPQLLVAVLKLLREQLNAHCPNREYGETCVWAKTELAQKFAEVLSGPVYAAIADLDNAVNSEENARRRIEDFLVYALQSPANNALQATLASVSDLVQLLASDEVFSPIFNTIYNVANPADDAEGPGAADRTVQLLKAVSGDAYDRYHVLDYVLPGLVTPIQTVEGDGVTPLEIIFDVIADVNRVDASLETPLNQEDYRIVFDDVFEFLTDDERGFEQLYYIVQNRPRP